MNKLIIGENEYELFEIGFPRFIIGQVAAYPVIHAQINWEPFIDGDGCKFNNYEYESIRFNGKYYGYKLIEKQKEVWQP